MDLKMIRDRFEGLCIILGMLCGTTEFLALITFVLAPTWCYFLGGVSLSAGIAAILTMVMTSMIPEKSSERQEIAVSSAAVAEDLRPSAVARAHIRLLRAEMKLTAANVELIEKFERVATELEAQESRLDPKALASADRSQILLANLMAMLEVGSTQLPTNLKEIKRRS